MFCLSLERGLKSRLLIQCSPYKDVLKDNEAPVGDKNKGGGGLMAVSILFTKRLSEGKAPLPCFPFLKGFLKGKWENGKGGK